MGINIDDAIVSAECTCDVCGRTTFKTAWSEEGIFDALYDKGWFMNGNGYLKCPKCKFNDWEWYVYFYDFDTSAMGRCIRRLDKEWEERRCAGKSDNPDETGRFVTVVCNRNFLIMRYDGNIPQNKGVPLQICIHKNCRNVWIPFSGQKDITLGELMAYGYDVDEE